MKQELVKGHYAQTLMGLCDNHDLGSLRVGDVIAASGMSKPTFYHHFSNLSELVNFAASRSYLGTGTVLFTETNIKSAYDYALAPRCRCPRSPHKRRHHRHHGVHNLLGREHHASGEPGFHGVEGAGE